ncbi:MAG: VWA domain-containing protein [Cyanobacteria bacterium P01_A01_bin.40]
MVLYTPQPSWRYAIFQVPAFLAVVFLTLALLTNLWGWFPPTVSVKMMLDLSSSTYQGSDFRGVGTLMAAEIEAVKAYARENAATSRPNSLSLSGFADQVIPITSDFASDAVAITSALDTVVQPAIALQVGSGTNLDLAVKQGLASLSSQSKCKELLVITDGEAHLDQVQLIRAQDSGVKLNFLIVRPTVPANLARAAEFTRGVALPTAASNIQDLVANQLRQRFNSNSKFVNLFWGLAFIAVMWMLVLPLDRFLQRQWQIRFDFAGRLALFNALFWTLLTLWWWGLPVVQGC